MPCDGYRGVICLIGASQMGENHEDGADDYGACLHKASIFVRPLFVKSARLLESGKRYELMEDVDFG